MQSRDKDMVEYLIDISYEKKYEDQKKLLKKEWKNRWEELEEYIEKKDVGDMYRVIKPYFKEMRQEIKRTREVSEKNKKEINKEINKIFTFQVSKSLLEILKDVVPKYMRENLRVISGMKHKRLRSWYLKNEERKEIKRISKMFVIHHLKDSLVIMTIIMKKLRRVNDEIYEIKETTFSN